MRHNRKVRSEINRWALGAAALSVWSIGAASAWAQPMHVPLREAPVHFDSGVVANPADEPRVVWSDVIHVPDAIWLELKFEVAELDFNPRTGEGSFVRMTSLDDGASQRLNAVHMREWQQRSAAFNGNAVEIELLAMPRSQHNRIRITTVIAGEPVWPKVGPSSICDGRDDRLPSNDPRVARGFLQPNARCSTWLYDDGFFPMTTAGHCDYIRRADFNVPLSDPNGNPRFPHPDDQYAADPASLWSSGSSQVGNDWAYYCVFPNPNTNLMPFEAQGRRAFRIESPTPPGQQYTQIRITGFGVVSSPVPPEWNRAQKTHVGEYREFVGTTLRYRPDTTSGNSGSPVIPEFGAGDISIGVHTHGGCTSQGGANQGTAASHTGWINARNNPRGVCAPFDLAVTPLIRGQAATATVSSATPSREVYFIYSVAGLGSQYIGPLGVHLGVLRPQLGGSTMADSAGNAEFHHQISPNAPGVLVSIQAAQVGRTSNVVQRLIMRQ